MDITWMPGPTDEARELQLAQANALDAVYDSMRSVDLLNANAREALKANPEYQAARARYEQTVQQLQALLGPDAHCNCVDCELWSFYSDCFKSDHGFRPREHMTRADVKAAVERMSDKPVEQADC